MLEVLEPFEVGDGDTASIAEDIRPDHNTILLEDSLSISGGWAIGSLSKDLALDLVRVVPVDRG